jgi:hypothetical protein
MNLFKQQTLKNILFVLLLASTFGSKVLAQCGAGQSFRTVEFPTGAPATGTFICGAGVSVTKTDAGGPNFPSLAAHYAAAAAGAFVNTGPGGNTPSAYTFTGGGYSDYTIYDNGYTDVVYTFSTPVVDPILFIGGVGIDYGGSIEVIGKTITKVAGAGNFNVVGSTISAAFIPTPGFPLIPTINSYDQRGHVKVSGTHSTITLRMKSLASPAAFQLYTVGIGSCYSASITSQLPVCTGEIWTATHSVPDAVGYYTAAKPGVAQMKDGNGVTIVKNDITGVSVTAEALIGGDTYTNGIVQCFPHGGASVTGGGYLNMQMTVNGTTELTYTFCRPVTDAYLFFGYGGINPGTTVEFDKAITIMDAEDEFVMVGTNTVGVCGTTVFRNGYVKINGTQTSFKIKVKTGALYADLLTLMVGSCVNVPTKVAGAPLACTGTATLTPVNIGFTSLANGGTIIAGPVADAYKTVGTSAAFNLKDNLNAPINDAYGNAVKVTITTAGPLAAPDGCGVFSADPILTYIGATYTTTQVTKGGDGFSYTYKFTKPVKVQLSNQTYNFGVVYNEVLAFEAKKAGSPVNVNATVNLTGKVTTIPGKPLSAMIIGTVGGNFWKAWPDTEVDEITISYKSNNNDAYKQESHQLEICSAPCDIIFPACAAANQRTEAFGFTRNSATNATGSKGANNVTMITTANVPILAAVGSGASAMNPCGGSSQMSVSSGGWALLGAKANQTGEKITVNFSQPVTNPMVMVWGIYNTTQLDVAGVATCLKPVQSYYGATVTDGLTLGTTDKTSITGTLGLAGIGYYQIPGVYTSLTFDVKTGIFENWFYMSVGEGVCSPAPEVVNTSTVRKLECTGGGTVKTYDANFDYINSAYKTVSGKMYSPSAAAYPGTPGINTANDITVDCNVNNAYWLGLYGLTSYPAGQVPASAGCTPGTGDFASAGGGAVYAYAGVGQKGNIFPALWTADGQMKISFKNSVVNPIIKVKYLSWTKLTFKDCNGTAVPIVPIPGTMKYGLVANGSSIYNTPIVAAFPNNAVLPNEWSDGIEGEGAVQLIGTFKDINITVEKTDIWLDYFSITVAEQTCTTAPPPTVVCDAVVPMCDGGKAATTVAAGFTKTAVNGAVGSLTEGGKPVVTTLVSTSEVLTANTDRAAGTFADAACYAIKPVGGGAVTIKDIGGNGLTTIAFGRAITNPLIYIKDLTRLELNFGTTLDINGSPVCCMKQISGANGFTTTGTKVADNNPTQNGSPTEKLTPGCGLVQLVGTFTNIVIQSSRPSGDTRFNDWTVSIGGEAVCLPDAVLASLGSLPQDPANPTIPPATVVSPASLAAPVALQSSKTLVNVVPKNPAQPEGNQIVTFEIEIKNPSATTVTGLYIEDKLDEKFAPGVIVGIAAAPKVIWPHYAFQQGNPAFNGVTIQDLILTTGGTNMLKAGDVIRITYSVEINPKLIPASAGRVTNTVKMGSTTMAVSGAAEASMYLPSAVMLPTNQESGICSGKGGVEFAKFLQCAGGAKVMPNAACGKIKWGWSWEHDYAQPHCGNAETKKVLFTGADECGNNYKYEVTFTTKDDCPPTLDMLPMDKTVSCGDAAATTSINMWLNKAGGAWVSDPGQEPGSVTSSHDYKQTGCNPGVYTVIFTFTDACGKSINAPAKLTLLAKTGTSASLRMNNTIANKVINCSDVMKFDAPEMETTCPDGVINVTFKDEDVAGTCAMEHEVLRTWIYTDNCGNEYVAKQNIKLTDNTAPQFDATLPTSFTMNKGLFKVWQKLFFAQAKATDNCSAVTLSTPTYTVITDKQVLCKVVATDGCGNSSTYQCTVNFNDTKVKPVFKEAATNTTTAEAIIKDLEVYIAASSTVEVPTEAVIYPNPTEQMVNIIPAQGNGDIQKIHVYNMDGRVLLNMDVEGMQNKTISIDISNFASGTYIIEMQHTEKNVFSKVQKIK